MQEVYGDINKLYKTLQISNINREIRTSIHVVQLNNKLNSQFAFTKNAQKTTYWSCDTQIKIHNL